MNLEIGTAEVLTPEIVSPVTSLVTIEPCEISTVFIEGTGLDPILTRIEQLVTAHIPDVSTPKGRAEIKSLAFKVVKSRTYLDSLGKDLVAEYKSIPDRIDANRRAMRERLLALEELARKPLVEWEQEQERIAQEEQARIQAEHERKAQEALERQVVLDHEMALLMNEKFDRDLADRLRAEEEYRIAKEARIAEEAAERARKEAEDRAAAEAETLRLREAQALLAQQRAEREKAEAEQRAKDAEARAEQERKDAVERERVAAEQAAQRERDRQAAAARAEAEAQAAREKDREHRKKLNLEALVDIVKATGITEDQAKACIAAIAMGKIRNVKINY